MHNSFTRERLIVSFALNVTASASEKYTCLTGADNRGAVFFLKIRTEDEKSEQEENCRLNGGLLARNRPALLQIGSVAAYLAYFLRNLSTRPAVSTTRCLPV